MNSHHLAILFPGAKSVVLEADFGEQPLTAAEDGWWSLDVAFPTGDHRYRFRVDNIGTLPDPFNSLYVHEEGQYFSVSSGEQAWDADFREEPQLLYFSDQTPTSERIPDVRRKFGPGQPHIFAILLVNRLHRPKNHLLWHWVSPHGRTWLLEGVVSNRSAMVYSVMPYDGILHHGRWEVRCYLNGRYCGCIACRINSIGYPSSTIEAVRLL